jgi:hypothetical protein
VNKTPDRAVFWRVSSWEFISKSLVHLRKFDDVYVGALVYDLAQIGNSRGSLTFANFTLEQSMPPALVVSRKY